MTIMSVKNKSVAWGLLLISISVVFAPLFINDTLLFDDPIVANHQEAGDLKEFKEFMTRQGGIEHGWINSIILSSTYYRFIYQVIALSSLCLICISCFEIFKLFGASPKASSTLSLGITIFPYYIVWGNIVCVSYLVTFACFCIGIYLLFKSMIHYKIWTRALAVLFLFCSFWTPSIQFFYYGVLLLLFCINIDKTLSNQRNIVLFFRMKWYLFLIPLVFLFAQKKLNAVHKIYGNYNSLFTDPIKISKNLIKSLIYPQIQFVEKIKDHLMDDPFDFLLILSVSAVISMVLVYLLRYKPVVSQVSLKVKTSPSRLIITGILLLIIAVFPYSLVNKPVHAIGYAGRFSLLYGIPVVIILWGFYRLLKIRYRIKQFLVFAFLTICISSVIMDQILWQNRYIKYLAIVEELKSHPDEGKSLIFISSIL